MKQGSKEEENFSLLPWVSDEWVIKYYKLQVKAVLKEAFTILTSLPY